MAKNTDLVRTSRDGDQFHYLWAARQCLRLLPGTENLVAITIEGASEQESKSKRISDGEEIIDVGFYFGSEDRTEAERIQYVQLKHSTVASNEPWTASGLKKTIQGFVARYQKLLDHFSAENIAERFRFEFTTNRPIDKKVVDALVDLKSDGKACTDTVHKTLLRYSGLNSSQASVFFKLFNVVGSEHGLWEQQNLLVQDLSAYLVDADYDTPVQLKDLVTRKATTEFEFNPSIRRHDVLRALKVSENVLLPAPCLISTPPDTIPREQENSITQKLLQSNVPLIIHADGGVGKSIIAARIARSIPAESAVVLYDCFGDGLYRSSLHFRHRHEDGLVQIANELAARGLCHPLIPSKNADSKQYVRAFKHRITQAIGVLRSQNQNASLCIIIDAADNAEMAAGEQQDPVSFVRDLIRLECPDGVRLAFTCRTHRRTMLGAKANSVELNLQPFSLNESALHLRKFFPEANDTETNEFHFLSSFNPRVQALALERKVPLREILKGLGPEPTTVEQAIGDLLESAIAKLKDNAGSTEAHHIDMMCKGLAVLRPLIPIPVLARLSQTPESAIRSFVLDFGRPLLLKGNSLHFLDEPTETWFRERFKPSQAEITGFVERLQSLASESSYVASALPPLLLEAGMMNELISLALSGEGLPAENPLEKRDVELQRLTFSIKASLQQKRYGAAAKLALKAGGECAGEGRQNALIQSNTDLAAKILSPDRIEEIVSRGTFKSGWMGAYHAYDAGLLSGKPEFIADASSRLRMAIDWLHNWARSKPDRGNREDVSHEDRVELASAILRLRGPGETARFLRGWRSRYLAFDAGRGLGARLIDLGHYDQLDALIEATGNDIWLLLGLFSEANSVGHSVPIGPLRRVLRLLGDRRVKLIESSNFNDQWAILEAVCSTVELALKTAPKDQESWGSVIQRYLPSEPPQDFTSQFGRTRVGLLRAYALNANLQDKELELVEVAPKDIRHQIESNNHYSHSQELRMLKREVGGHLPWVNLFYGLACGRTPKNLESSIEQALSHSNSCISSIYSHDSSLIQVIAFEWLRIIISASVINEQHLSKFTAWLKKNEGDIWPNTLTNLCRLAARTEGLESLSFDLSVSVFERLEKSREHAESRVESYVELARAIYPLSTDEASAYFDQAIEIASRIGDENIDRWSAFLHLSEAAGEQNAPRPRTAYRLSRLAELTYEYVARDKHFDWDRTAESLVELCPCSALAILSRWRDRRFGNSDRLLPIAIYHLCALGHLPKYAPIVLSGIHAEWSRARDLEQAVVECDSKSPLVIFDIGYRYVRVSTTQKAKLIELKELGKSIGAALFDIDRLIANEASNSSDVEEIADSERARDEQSINWGDVFASTDFSCPDSLRMAYETARQQGTSIYLDSFFKAAFEHVRIGKESLLIKAICNWPDFGIYTVRYLLDALSLRSKKQISTKRSIKEAVLIACRRNPEKVFRRSWWQPIPFQTLYDDGLVTDEEVVQETLTGFESQIKDLDAGGLFKLLEPLAATLSPDEADEVLHFGFDLLEDILNEEDSDGAWRAELAPAGSVESAVAGYVWAGLGSPVASERWEYAHVVRALVELGWVEVLEELTRWADQDEAFPYVDGGFEFYLWHARQWLLIGLSRGGLENPFALNLAADFLCRMANLNHVLIREFAAQGIRILVDSGYLMKDDVSGLMVANKPALSEKTYSGWNRAEPDDDEEEDVALSDDERYFFGIDIGPYWLEPLGRAFGIAQDAVENRARSVLRKHLGWNGKRGYEQDARGKKGIFNDRETSHSHGSMPKTDSLKTYQCFHAMMIVAADLLAQRSVLRNIHEEADEFQQWLEKYQLTRKDGYWLFDRRDPPIQKNWSAPEGKNRQDWKWGITAEYLDGKLNADDGGLNLWGHYTKYSDSYSEVTKIRSALVSRSGAGALVVALQTSAELEQYALPSANGDDCLQMGELTLKGWVFDDDVYARLDEYDPWSTNLAYPGPMPSAEVSELMNLNASADGRRWWAGKDGLLRSQSWIEAYGYGRDEEMVGSTSLSASPEFIEELLTAYPTECLIISVAVSRTVPKYEESSEERMSYHQPYVRFYLMEKDGVAKSI
ncbi:hypothetical protein [Shewanella sp. FJAT-52076]|uniref:hypothetical protein n=1 Tax=Shewanella sp. FJAT-52076 TaxID=2864202 RepID=UPI001C6607B3|nr:hypothetical protein [Shewanella sp. FJAT-52076]QYJ75319.1 hypothetical protein K0H79_18600 [Shewanella sp. FJAT-52076]